MTDENRNIEKLDAPLTAGPEQSSWSAIRSRRIDFHRYQKFVDDMMSPGRMPIDGRDAPAYDRLKLATERYLRQECGLSEEGESKAGGSCMLELIWSYWHEEGMLVQSIGAVGRRFQNVNAARDRDPLGAFEIDPLRPLSNLLWGYVQDEPHRLTPARRAYEYDHHYGLRLGDAAPKPRSAAPRSTFLDEFHRLLHAVAFFRQDDDTTVVGDASPVLNALRAVRLVLAEGAHNQFGDLPTTARAEMLMDMWLLARPEVREFLREPLPDQYEEPWMGAVDRMKALQRGSAASIRDYHALGVSAEQLVLSVRYENWAARTAPIAGNWARYWRPEIQQYIHAYRAVTGVDVASTR